MLNFDTNWKGNLAEGKVLSEFQKYGCVVSIPYGNNARYDLIADINNKLCRVQVKYIDSKLNNGYVCLFCNRNTHTGQKLSYVGEVELFAEYIAELDICLLFTAEQVGNKKSISVRIEPPNNGQRNYFRVEDYTFDKYFSNLGIKPIQSQFKNGVDGVIG